MLKLYNTLSRKKGNIEQRLLIISNRLPVSIEKRKGRFLFNYSVGGLATGLGSFYNSYHSLWIGWPGISLDKIKEEKKNIETKLKSEFNCYPVFLSQNDIEKYYYGFCNKTIWPLFHYFPQYTIYNKSLWKAYKRVNELFSERIMEIIKPDDIIWIHDYQLMLLPKLIREKMPTATIGFFLHIPFPSFELFRLLQWRKEILDGFSGADVIGFHTYDYVRHFLSSVHQLLGQEPIMGQITTAAGRIVKVDAFPMGIEYERFFKAKEDSKVQEKVIRFRKKLGNRKLILSIDRLDYTKGILQRLEAFNTFLKRNPEYKEKVTLILVVVPSRTQVEQYRLLKKQVDELVGRINGEYGNIDWTPIWYIYRSLPFSSLIALYNIADVALVTPLRDGMNLIAKEYIATKRDGKGVLVLSEMAGVAKELGEAIIVNPNNNEGIAEALEKALIMPEEEQIENNTAMQKRLQRYNILRWAEDFIDRLLQTKKLQKEMGAKMLVPEMKRKLISDYRKNKRRLLLLDYDGTLVPFFGRPEGARPNESILKLLEKLTEEPKNEVILISGRDKNTLERWFGSLNLGLISEHGAWIKEKGGTWKMIKTLTNEWKEEIRPILELQVDRTTGSFIEEKEFSLAWHYRKSDPELGSIRARELMDNLINLTGNLNLQILEGNKVIEIKNSDINKGEAALQWISKEKWGFILVAGDDLTDEDIFSILPETAYSIRVGLTSTKARFNLTSPRDVLLLLNELTS